MEDVRKYYNQPIADKARRERIGVPGAGLIWVMTRDQLSPPVNVELNQSGDIEEWKKATERRVLSLVRKLGIKNGDLVMDLGSGVGGPARLVEEEFSAKVIQLNISHTQLASAQELSPSKDVLGVNADAVTLPLADNSLDAAYSINALYHVPNIAEAFVEIRRSLKSSGCIGIDDWFITKEISPENLASIRNHWSTAKGFHEYSNFLEEAKKQGLRIVGEIDFTENAGLFLKEERFGKIYDERAKTEIGKAFLEFYADQGYETKHAECAAQELREGILKMGELYRNGQAVYRQVIMQKV